MSLSARWLATVAGVASGTLVVLAAVPGQAAAAGPAPLSMDHARVDVDSSHGSGTFGRWGVDGRGLPRYRYEINEKSARQAAQEELAGKRDAWHQLGNDHVVADAFNHGYTQLWSMDNLYQWANYAEPASQHYAGGYGYLNVDGKVGTTLYDDRAAGQKVQRDFGLGYFRTGPPSTGSASPHASTRPSETIRSCCTTWSCATRRGTPRRFPGSSTGTEPVLPRRPHAPRPRGPEVRPEDADSLGPAAAGAPERIAPDDIRGRRPGTGSRLRHERIEILRIGRPGSAERGQGEPALAVHRRSCPRRRHRPHRLLPSLPGPAATRPERHAALRVRDGQERKRSGAGPWLPQEPEPVRGLGVALGEVGSAGESGRLADLAVPRASAGRVHVRSDASMGSPPATNPQPGAIPSTTSTSRAPTATRSSTRSR